MRYLLLLFMPYFLCASPIKIATYNVENLFDASFQGTEYEEYIPGKHNWNSRMVDIKLNHVAEVICDLDADILGLQEIENKGIFQRLIERLEKVGCAYDYSAITSKKGASIQVALLSKHRIVDSRDIEVSLAPRVRNILEVDVEVGGEPLTIFVNHWKSKAYKGYESKRIAYANALQARIARLAPSKEYIILGDFNSDHNAYLTLEDKNNDTQGKSAFSDVLQTRVEEYEVLHAQRGSHYTLWKELAVEDRWSHKFYGKKSSLDQIVLPQKMFDGRGIDYVNNSFKVFKAGYLFTKRGYINRWQYKKGKHRAKGYSDHLPVFAYFDAKPYEKEVYTKKKKIVTNSIEYLYSVDKLDNQIKLNDVVVVFKRGNSAVVKQEKDGRGIFLYGCARDLKEGERYDLQVESIKSYFGLKEITSAYKIKSKGYADLEQYYLDTKALHKEKLRQNEILRDVVGIYRNKSMYIDNKKIPLHFRNKKHTPKDNSKIKLHYAHVGYYKGLQLVIYTKKDFEIMEK
ncbi:MAG: endonuclease/exonuclease/phosphatase family protein [Campylobacterota bacterium]|nr:endonuclease/exonuclease/phosphatase family protein [Campylobacterota bacterium]